MVFFRKILKEKISNYIVVEMFTEKEQEEIINEFVKVIKMKTYINEKVSMCRKCKFTEENLNLYNLPIPESAIKTICNSITKNARHVQHLKH